MKKVPIPDDKWKCGKCGVFFELTEKFYAIGRKGKQWPMCEPCLRAAFTVVLKESSEFMGVSLDADAAAQNMLDKVRINKTAI